MNRDVPDQGIAASLGIPDNQSQGINNRCPAGVLINVRKIRNACTGYRCTVSEIPGKLVGTDRLVIDRDRKGMAADYIIHRKGCLYVRVDNHIKPHGIPAEFR